MIFRKKEQEKPIRGGRNLIILGLSSAAIAALTTIVSLQIYRSTGDIYLDRSRPGYIFEDEKHNEEDDQKEVFSSEGEINQQAIDEYLGELDKIIQRIDASSGDFSPEPLSDDSLSISVAEEEPQEEPVEQ
jgi:hypothetical protein